MKSTYSKNDIVEFLSKKYGETINPISIVEGQESQTLSFTHDKQEFVLRINPMIEGFLKDDYAYRTFSSSKISIPKVIEYGHFNDKHAFCVSEKVQGITFQDADEAIVDALLPDITELWHFISEIDISDTAGYGIFSSKDGNAPFESWHSHLLSTLDRQKYDWEKVRHMKNVDTKLINDLRLMFIKLLPYCPEERKLSHGDFGSNNVLVDSSIPQITAIIDWDNAKYGDPLYDVASAYYWKDWLMCMKKTSIYWNEVLCFLPNYQKRIMCYQLHIGLEEIYENALDENAETLVWLQKRCRQILNRNEMI